MMGSVPFRFYWATLYLVIIILSIISMYATLPRGGGGEGGTRLSFGRPVPLGGGGGVKTSPCLKPLGAQKIHPVTIYLTKNFHMHTLYWYGRTLYSAVYHQTFIKICYVPHARSLVPRSRACHKHCGLGTRLGSPGSNPVINGVASQ